MSRAPRFEFTLVDDDGDERDFSLPAKFVVCSRCQGAGVHVNPAIDGNGLTREDFDEDPDFAEEYFRGSYDISCETCQGARVEAQPDVSRCSFDEKRALVRYRRQDRERRRDYASEARLRQMEYGW